jgi:hypothetical protein
MKIHPSVRALAAVLCCAAAPLAVLAQPSATSGAIKHVLLISIDGMHALDYANCVQGVGGTGSAPTCPTLAQLGQTGVNYLQAFTPKPSDSFPGLTAIITGGSPRTAGMFYDVNYDRSLSPPALTTPYGIVGGATLCPGTKGTQVGLDEEIDYDLTKLDGGGGINPAYLPRDPAHGCAPVYPHQYIRANTIFEVVKAGGLYTAWSDKHPSYDFVNGPSGAGVNDLWSPEINSDVVPIPQVPGCATVPDPTADLTAWTNSFQNIQCYDTYKVQAVLNWIDGKTHDGSAVAPVPALLGMNFQAVSVGEKLVEGSTIGGYLDALGTPSPSLLGEIEYVDASIGKMVAELKRQGLLSSTLIIITAKHGQSPININTLLRIPGDNSALMPPSSILGSLAAQADEDDVSLLWLTDQTQTEAAVKMLQSSLGSTGGGEVYGGNAVKLMFNDPLTDSRTPDIIVTPNIGVVYTGGKGKVSEHGGFANDDTSVMLLVSNPIIAGSSTYEYPVRTAQVAPTIVAALGLNPQSLDGVQKEGTEVLPGLGLDAAPSVVIAPVPADVVATSIRLDASGSTDPNGLPLSFVWSNPTHNAGIIGGNTATPTVQFGGGRGQYSFSVIVSNSQGASASKTVSVNYYGR